ncbi:hypothetical protein [Oscillibacter sp. ER4]|uniref:hypothetical protein n=1 Tax=Oscillibacter sp. ER4 TaxID=1519439 RepID=UPI0012E01CC3|nr:hypothetical protein [Oscillibacter sp. ER4]
MPQSVNFLNCWHLDIKVNPFALSCSSSSEHLHKFGLITKGNDNVPHAFIANIDAVVQNLAIAKAEGKYRGRKPIERSNFDAVEKLWRAGTISAAEAMRRLDMSRSTFYRKVRQHL